MPAAGLLSALQQQLAHTCCRTSVLFSFTGDLNSIINWYHLEAPPPASVSPDLHWTLSTRALSVAMNRECCGYYFAWLYLSALPDSTPGHVITHCCSPPVASGCLNQSKNLFHTRSLLLASAGCNRTGARVCVCACVLWDFGVSQVNVRSG